MKITAIRSGGCYDCSCDHLIMPEGLDYDAERRAWQDWYRVEYVPSLRAGRSNSVKYISLIDWLKLKGAREPTAEEFEEIYD